LKITNVYKKFALFLLLGLIIFFVGVLGFLLGQQNKNGNVFAVGGVVPHHLLAGELIDGFFEKLSSQKPKRIILVGPDHRTTPEVSADFTSGVSKRFARGWYSEEHSITNILPFIEKYLPEAIISPIVLSNKMSLSEIENLADQLSKAVNKDTVLIASVDFSHYLKKQEAEENDKKTLEIIKNFDYQSLISLNSDYLDGPASTAVLLKVMQKTGHNNFEILDHTNSSELMDNGFSETTSYFVIRFY